MPEIKKFLDGNGLKFGLEYLLENMSVSAEQIQFSDGKDLQTKYDDLLERVEALEALMPDFEDGKFAFLTVRK